MQQCCTNWHTSIPVPGKSTLNQAVPDKKWPRHTECAGISDSLQCFTTWVSSFSPTLHRIYLKSQNFKWKITDRNFYHIKWWNSIFNCYFSYKISGFADLFYQNLIWNSTRLFSLCMEYLCLENQPYITMTQYNSAILIGIPVPGKSTLHYHDTI